MLIRASRELRARFCPSVRNARSLAWTETFCGLLLLLALAACATPTGNRPGAYTAPDVVTAETILGESALGAEVELERLGRTRTVPALLRRAWLELSLRHPQSALDATSEVLFGRGTPSANDEAFARYLRAEAYRQQGKPERGSFDLERAMALAIDPELASRLQVAAPTPTAVPTVETGLAISPRASWSANQPNRGNLDAMGKVTRVTIHHSAMLLRDPRPAACAKQIQHIQRDHMGTRGYGDIGYHFLIDPSGRVWQGRDLRFQGAHASGENNLGNIGICLLGNFMPGRAGQPPSDEQLAAMDRLVRHLMQRFQLQADDLYCHSHFKNTECPGPLVEPAVARLQRNLQRSQARVAVATTE